MSRPIFLTGLARGGTNLLARMLNAGGDSRIAIHAFQPWFKSLRNAIIAHDSAPDLVRLIDPDGPFTDGYFNDLQIAVQETLHRGTIDIPFAEGEWPLLLERLQARAAHDATDLVPGLSSLAGSGDYRVMMDRILALVRRGHEDEPKYVGLIDTWIVDLLPALARAYPDARFLVVIRDPRAIVASQLKFLDIGPEQVGHILSILRQWRKTVTLSHQYLHDRLFKGRFHFVRYEDQVKTPEKFARDLCEFLGLAYQPAMTDFTQYADQSKNHQWKGNSAFVNELHHINPKVAERWWRSLPPDALAAVEFCCGLDMAVCGYTPVSTFDKLASDPRPLAFLTADGKRECSWRTDTGDPEVEYTRETERRALAIGSAPPGGREIRRAFLSPSYFEVVKSSGRLFSSA